MATERSIYWSAFLVRCLLGLVAWTLSEHTGLSLVEDASLYERVGAKIAREWIDDGSSSTLALLMEEGAHAWVMYVVLAIFSFLLRGARALPVVIVLFNLVTAWVPVFTHRIARLLGLGPAGVRWATGLVVFSPVFAFWAGALYKEGLVLLALNVIVYHVLVLQRELRFRSVLTVALALILLLGLRFYLAALLIPALALGIAVGAKQGVAGAPRWPFRRAIAIGSVALVLLGFGFRARLSNLLPESSTALLENIQSSRDDLASAGSGYSIGADVSRPAEALRFLPTGALLFLSVPLPWQVGSLRQTLVLPEMVFWLVQYPMIFLGMRVGLERHRRGAVLLGSVTLVMLVFYGLFVGNAGTAYRLRAQIWLFWAIFAGWYRARDAAPP